MKSILPRSSGEQSINTTNKFNLQLTLLKFCLRITPCEGTDSKSCSHLFLVLKSMTSGQGANSSRFLSCPEPPEPRISSPPGSSLGSAVLVTPASYAHC